MSEPAPLRVFNMPGTDRLPTLSPFGLKLETWLRIVGVPYERHDAFFHHSPNGHLPFIEHGGERMTETARIIAYVGHVHGVDPDRALDARQRALATLMRASIEESFKFVRVYDAFAIEDNFQRARAYVNALLPEEQRDVVPAAIRKGLLEKLHHQGTALLTTAEVHARGEAIVDALAELLGAGPYFFGEAPTTIDAVAYGFLATQLRGHVISPVTRRVAQHERLVAYVARIDDRFWS